MNERMTFCLSNRCEIGHTEQEINAMVRFIILLSALVLATTVSAQEPKAVKTVKTTQSLNDTALCEVKDDGNVAIGWEEVEALAASK